MGPLHRHGARKGERTGGRERGPPSGRDPSNRARRVEAGGGEASGAQTRNAGSGPVCPRGAGGLWGQWQPQPHCTLRHGQSEV